LKKITLEVNDKIFKMLEEINEFYKADDGINSSIEELIEGIVFAHYMVEVGPKKDSKHSNPNKPLLN
jgi:hypothetical protein